jgi:hypothetical protein
MQPHVTQHELFIRAAMEGRRDHVYQACMYDPLTAATLTLDQIVEMCDELIEAHGDSLPKLEKKSLVPTSGKTFSPPTPQELRASWDEAQAKTTEDSVAEYQIIGPFSGPEAGKISINAPTPVEDDFTAQADGSVDLTKSYGDAQWKSVSAEKGFVDLNRALGHSDYVVAYAYFEVESVHQRETVLKCGSDDGIKIWLNGDVVHEVDAQRGHTVGSDQKTIFLKAGLNRFLVKISQHTQGWGFSVIVPRANF